MNKGTAFHPFIYNQYKFRSCQDATCQAVAILSFQLVRGVLHRPLHIKSSSKVICVKLFAYLQ